VTNPPPVLEGAVAGRRRVCQPLAGRSVPKRPARSRELGSVILTGPFQLEIF